jgi:hypothetical protein
MNYSSICGKKLGQQNEKSITLIRWHGDKTMAKAPGSARKQRTDKGKLRGPRTVAVTGNGGDGRVLAADDNSLDQNAVRENWHHHRKWWKAHHLRQALLDEQYRNGVKALKADGHAIESMRVADKWESVKHAAKVEQQIKLSLTVAWYLGLPMGAQLDLFQNPHINILDQAYEAGKVCALEGKALRTDYAPETPEYHSFANGYHEIQAEHVRKGLRPLEDTEQAAEASDGEFEAEL